MRQVLLQALGAQRIPENKHAQHQHNAVSLHRNGGTGTHKKRVREQELQERLTAQLSCIGHDRSDHEGRHVIHEIVHLRSNELALDDGLADTT